LFPTISSIKLAEPSGSEVVEAALKIAIKCLLWKGQNKHVNFIGRNESYHRTTIGSLFNVWYHTRREPYHPASLPSSVSGSDNTIIKDPCP